MKKPLKIFLITVVFVFVCSLLFVLSFLFFPSFLNIFPWDTKPVDDSDLSVLVRNIPDNQNAYFDLLASIQNYNDKTELSKEKELKDFLNLEKWDEFLVRESLEKNGIALDFFSQATFKNSFQDPFYGDLSIIGLEKMYNQDFNILKLRKVAQLSALKSIYLAKQGRFEEAFLNARNIIKVGEMLEGSNTSMSGFLIGQNIKKEGLINLQTLLSLDLNSDYKKLLLDFSQSLEPLKMLGRENFKRAIKAEYLFSKNTLMELKGNEEIFLSYNQLENNTEKSERLPLLTEKGLKSGYFFQPNRTNETIAKLTRSEILLVDQSSNSSGFAKIQDYINKRNEEEIRLRSTSFNYLNSLLLPNSLGKMILNIITVNHNAVIKKIYQEDALIVSTQTLLALKSFEMEKGEKAKNLEELVFGGYLKNVPLDPYNNKPLNYNYEKQIVYSVGENLIDEGGEVFENKDLVYKLNF